MTSQPRTPNVRAGVERPSPARSPDLGSSTPLRHPVFAHFPPYKGILKRGFSADYIGSTTRPEYLGSWAAEHDVEITAEYPPVSEELFEWIELLESVLDAGSRYTYVELGAGYGRWTARAAQAARRRGITEFRAVLVEAEPQHAQWARQHMQDNGLRPDQYVLMEAAVGAKAGQASFAVEMPGEASAQMARDWYGQGLMPYVSNDRVSGRTYHDRPILERDDGYHSIQVETLTLEAVLAELEYVDLVDMDIQSAEADVIDRSGHVLEGKVGRLSVGTHRIDLHERVREALEGLGWIERWNYRPGHTEDTPFGPVSFQDGVSSWINPRFISPNPPSFDPADGADSVPDPHAMEPDRPASTRTGTEMEQEDVVAKLDIVHTLVPGGPSIELVAYYPKFRRYYLNCEPETKSWMVQHVRSDWRCLDVGANIGYFTILLSRLARQGHIWAYEPTSTFDMLRQNLEYHGCQNVTTRRVALGEREGDLDEAIYRIWGTEPERKVYSFTTIDREVGRLGLDQLDLIKIDVDGFDLEVLHGAAATLARFNPWLIVELSDSSLSTRGQTVAEARAWLHDQGYHDWLLLDLEGNHLLRRAGTHSALQQPKSLQDAGQRGATTGEVIAGDDQPDDPATAFTVAGKQIIPSVLDVSNLNPHLFVVHSNGCAATTWTAKALNAHPEILCLHAANRWIREGMRETYSDVRYLEMLLNTSSGYLAVGDVHGIPRDEISRLKELFGSQFTSVVLVREPIARLNSMLGLFNIARANGHYQSSQFDYVHDVAESRGISSFRADDDRTFFVHGVNQLNAIVFEQDVGTIYRSEDVTTKPAVLATLVEEVTAGRVRPTWAWLEETIQLQRVSSHRFANKQTTLGDWQIDVLRKMVYPEAWAMYRDLGYQLPDFLD